VSPKAIVNSRRFLHLKAALQPPRIDPATLPTKDDEPFDISLPSEYFEAYRCEPPDGRVSVTKAQLLDMYLEMSKMRKLEVKADDLYRQKKIRGFCHLAIGQEAVYVGMENAMTRKDVVIGAYRIHTLAAQRGETMRAVFAELLGKRSFALLCCHEGFDLNCFASRP
jgi:pyruvate dehydrogenase E1 component alpha subunit